MHNPSDIVIDDNVIGLQWAPLATSFVTPPNYKDAPNKPQLLQLSIKLAICWNQYFGKKQSGGRIDSTLESLARSLGLKTWLCKHVVTGTFSMLKADLQGYDLACKHVILLSVGQVPLDFYLAVFGLTTVISS